MPPLLLLLLFWSPPPNTLGMGGGILLGEVDREVLRPLRGLILASIVSNAFCASRKRGSFSPSLGQLGGGGLLGRIIWGVGHIVSSISHSAALVVCESFRHVDGMFCVSLLFSLCELESEGRNADQQRSRLRWSPHMRATMYSEMKIRKVVQVEVWT